MWNVNLVFCCTCWCVQMFLCPDVFVSASNSDSEWWCGVQWSVGKIELFFFSFPAKQKRAQKLAGYREAVYFGEISYGQNTSVPRVPNLPI